MAVDPLNDYAAAPYDSPLPSESTAWGMTVGPDKHIYLGSYPNAHLFKFNTQTTLFTDLGQPIDTESNIWSLTMSLYDKKIYGGTSPFYGSTSPSAYLFSYDTATGVKENLGSMDDPSNQFARFCVADPDYPYIYVGTACTSTKIVAHNIQTKEITPLLVGIEPDWPCVWLGSDKRVYGYVGSNKPTYVLSNGTATYTPTSQESATNRFKNNDTICIKDSEDKVKLTHSDGTNNCYTYTYLGTGNDLTIFRVGMGPDGNIYAGTTAPFNLASWSPANPGNGFTRIGRLGNGEAYSLLLYGQKLYIGAYSALPTLSTFMTYTPGLPVNLDPSSPLNPAPCIPNCDPPTPYCILGDWRPKTLIAAPNKNLYAGSIGGSGILKGPLVAWNPQTNTARPYYPFPDQGIASLVVAEDCTGISGSTFCLVGGSTIYGGPGTRPTAANAVLFTFDPTTNELKNQHAIRNAPKATSITDLIVNPDPAAHYVYGIANENELNVTTQKSYLFIYDPATDTFVNDGIELEFYVNNEATYNSVAIGSDGNIWGITAGSERNPAGSGVFTINVTTNIPHWVATAPQQITSGFGFGFVKDAVNGDKIYFGIKADLYVYTVPKRF